MSKALITIVNEQTGPCPVTCPGHSYSKDQGYQPPIDMTPPNPNGPFTSGEDVKKYGLDTMYQNGQLLTVSQAQRVMQKRFGHAREVAETLLAKLKE